MTAPRPLALVTGASSGIGRVFAERLAQRGHDLLLVARDAARLEALAGELAGAHGIACEVFPADLSETGDIARVAARIAGESRLAVLVNNAGFGTRGVIGKADPEGQRRMLTLHVQAVHELTQAAIPGMRERRAGHIIVVASVASWVAAPGNVNYNATKAYQRMYCEALASELAGSGVHVQALCPGFTYSEFHDRLGTGRRGLPGWSFLSAERVVGESLAQAFAGGRVVCVPGKRWKAIVFMLKYAAPLLAPLQRRYRRD
jgi:short-subunit dehydrogenase